jgi:menaquinone-dependent protoporphyrinogen IX oxidase
MKTAIIYTSKHGTTAKIAQMIAERLTGNQVSIIDLKKDKRPDINSFDEIMLGASVYAGTPSKAMQGKPRNIETKVIGVICLRHGTGQRQTTTETGKRLSSGIIQICRIQVLCRRRVPV